MGKSLLLLLVLGFPGFAFSVETPKTAPTAHSPPAAPPASKRVHYSLSGLRPLGISQYAVPSRSAQREYIRFQNEQGNHYFIYEEAQGVAGLAELKHFREVMGRWEMTCSVELDCKVAAFCTGNCKNLYYEMSNTPEDLELLERNHCSMLTYRCEKPVQKPMATVSKEVSK